MSSLLSTSTAEETLKLINTKDEIIKSSLEELNLFTKIYQSNPWNYLIENDIQSDLFIRLRSRINITLTPVVAEIDGISATKLSINCINTEYNSRALPERARDRIDIVCIDPDPKNEPYLPWNGKPKHTDWIYSLPVLMGIELKHFWVGSKYWLLDLEKDLQKLHDMNVPKPLVLAYFHEEEELKRHWDYAVKKSVWDIKTVEDIDSFGHIYLIGPRPGLLVQLSKK